MGRQADVNAPDLALAGRRHTGILNRVADHHPLRIQHLERLFEQPTVRVVHVTRVMPAPYRPVYRQQDLGRGGDLLSHPSSRFLIQAFYPILSHVRNHAPMDEHRAADNGHYIALGETKRNRPARTKGLDATFHAVHDHLWDNRIGLGQRRRQQLADRSVLICDTPAGRVPSLPSGGHPETPDPETTT